MFVGFWCFGYEMRYRKPALRIFTTCDKRRGPISSLRHDLRRDQSPKCVPSLHGPAQKSRHVPRIVQGKTTTSTGTKRLTTACLRSERHRSVASHPLICLPTEGDLTSVQQTPISDSRTVLLVPRSSASSSNSPILSVTPPYSAINAFPILLFFLYLFETQIRARIRTLSLADAGDGCGETLLLAQVDHS